MVALISMILLHHRRRRCAAFLRRKFGGRKGFDVGVSIRACHGDAVFPEKAGANPSRAAAIDDNRDWAAKSKRHPQDAWRRTCPIPRRSERPVTSVTARKRSTSMRMGRPGKLEINADQADGDAARPVARLFAGRRRAGEGDRRGSGHGLRLHDARQHGRGHLQRHGHPRSRQSRRAGLQAGHGRQVGALQALRRRRFHRPRSRYRECRRVHQLRALPRPLLRRHQSRRHQGAGLFHHRAAPARADGHPGFP